MIIYPIFPTIVGKSSLDRDMTMEEKKFFDSDIEFERGVGNFTSTNNYILNIPELCLLKKNLSEKINEYVSAVYNPVEKIEVYITQSWVSITPPGHYHYPHKHPNSFLSGVFYVSVDRNLDIINFKSKEYSHIHIHPKEWNEYNSSQWSIKVSSGDIVIFPSHLEHDVPISQNKNNRISLAFNTYVKGNLGTKTSLTQLIL